MNDSLIDSMLSAYCEECGVFCRGDVDDRGRCEECQLIAEFESDAPWGIENVTLEDFYGD